MSGAAARAAVNRSLAACQGPTTAKFLITVQIYQQPGERRCPFANVGDVPAKAVDPAEMRAAVQAVLPWLRGEADQPERPVLASAVRLSLRALEQIAPGRSVEVRVPPFAAVQCVEGPRHTRGTPPNVIETDPRTWLELATGALAWDEALDGARVTASGTRADLSHLLPVVKF
ncbi:hypothetical protein GCM10022267_24670 [Lentzea roselyniae]|uniref:Bacterial SCP orthologue domain-containing protein n=2 Tax=Pseudonocardiaceae TaxID=2070 RepID=A0ABP7AQ19_9PSEU